MFVISCWWRHYLSRREHRPRTLTVSRRSAGGAFFLKIKIPDILISSVDRVITSQNVNTSPIQVVMSSQSGKNINKSTFLIETMTSLIQNSSILLRYLDSYTIALLPAVVENNDYRKREHVRGFQILYAKIFRLDGGKGTAVNAVS